MTKFYSLKAYIVLVVASFLTSNKLCCANTDDRKVYIVYMGSLPEGDYSLASHHNNMLQEVVDSSSSASDALVRSYKRSFNGFAAKLSDAERDKLARRSEVISIFPSRILYPQTTRSWDFMGFPEKIATSPSLESDVIVGVIDSGIWVDSESFNGAGFPPPPPRWKGACAGGQNFTCNNKVIGARFYAKEDSSAVDKGGHGTHTASTVAGNIVHNASFFGVGQGTARGGAPSARIAVYKVCGDSGCAEEDILGAFDDAISDGVDLISISIGPVDGPRLINIDSIAIGAFHAMANNILTVQSAGNDGNRKSSVGSISPWVFTVAASNTDHRIVDKIVLLNGKEFVGNSINSFSLKGTSFPIITGPEASPNCSGRMAEVCWTTCLDRSLVKGKIVICAIEESAPDALEAGALGVITPIRDRPDSSSISLFSAISLNSEDFSSVMDYVNSTKLPSGTILKSEGMKIGSPPQVASFSSRGPNGVIPDILKPDISAPGVDILAAYPDIATVASMYAEEERKSKYSYLSGTSMSCPHAAGVAAYVKSRHPNWSPSTIKSAIMTTAWAMNSTEDSDYEFAYGAGHINPVKAADPGLVYETTKGDYIKMLCGMGFDMPTLIIISGDKNITCPENTTESYSARNLNYPSMSAFLNTTGAFEIKFSRTVTNVGSPGSIYKSTVTSNNQGVMISVVPETLSFKSIGEKLDFVVTVSGKNGLAKMLSASVVWSDSVHNVRSPIVVYTQNDLV